MGEESNVTMVSQSFAVEYVGGACLTLLVYEYLVTFSQEGRIWRTSRGIPKVLYYLNRYLVSSMLMSVLYSFNAFASSMKGLDAPFCVFYLRWLTWTIWTQQTVVEGILLCRLRALYAEYKFVMYPLYMLYGAGVLTLLALTLVDYIHESVTIVNESTLPGCFAQSVPSIIAGYWITPVIIESVMFFLMIYKTINWLRFDGSAPPTVLLLARDSVVYFAIIFVLLLANLMVFEFGPPFLSSLLILPSNTAGCIAGSRMLLNIVGLNYNDDVTMAEMTELEFVHSKRGLEKGKSKELDTGFTGYTEHTVSDTVSSPLFDAPMIPYRDPVILE